jgi:uncharacterized DUF497 family protein
VKITCDPKKREATLKDRRLDFAEAHQIFAGRTFDIPDVRHDYGEARTITVGHLHGRMVVLVWTARGEVRHIISLRKANDREKARYGERFEQDRERFEGG